MDFYHMTPDKYLDCPIHALYGEVDGMTPYSAAVGWSEFTSKSMSLKLVGRRHLFTLEKEAMPALLEYLQEILTKVKAPLPLAMQQKLSRVPSVRYNGGGGETAFKPSNMKTEEP